VDKWAQRGLVATLAVAVLAGSTIGIILATKTADPALATQEVARTSATTRSQPPSAAITSTTSPAPSTTTSSSPTPPPPPPPPPPPEAVGELYITSFANSFPYTPECAHVIATFDNRSDTAVDQVTITSTDGSGAYRSTDTFTVGVPAYSIRQVDLRICFPGIPEPQYGVAALRESFTWTWAR
jgi:hypothetical protein